MRSDFAIHAVASCLRLQTLSNTFYLFTTLIFVFVLFIIVGPRSALSTQTILQWTPSAPCHCTHNNDVALLRDNLHIAKAELKDASHEIDLYILDLDAMRTQLAAETARADMASCKADVVCAKFWGLQRGLIAANATVAATKQEAAAASSELATSRNNLTKIQLDVAHSRKGLALARSEAEVSSATILDLQKELERARAETATARATAAAFEDAAAAAEDTVAATRMELAAARADADDLSFELKDAHATIAKLESRNDAANTRLKQARQELANMKADSGVILRAYDAADAATFVMVHAVRVAEIAQLREKEATFDNFKSIYAQKSMSEAQARAQAATLQERLSNVEDKYAQLTKHHMKVFLEQASMQMEIDRLRAKELEFELDNAKLTRTIDERDALQKTVSQLTAEAAIAKERHEQVLAVQKAQISEAERETSRQINIVIAERDRAQSEAYDISIQNKNLQSSNTNLRGEIFALQDKLRAAETARSAAETARSTATQEAECAALERSLSRPLARLEALALKDTIAKRDAEIEDLIKQLNAPYPARVPTPVFSDTPATAAQSRYQPLTPASSLELIEDRPLPTPPITPAGGVILRSPERDTLDTPLEDEDDLPVSPPRPVTPAATTPMRIPVRIAAPSSRPSTLADLFSSIPQAPVGPPSPIPRPSTVKPSHLGQSRLPRLMGTPRHNATIAQFHPNVPSAGPATRSPASIPLPTSPETGSANGTPARRRSPRAGPRRSNENEALSATPRYAGLPTPRPAFSAYSPASKAKSSQPSPASTGPKKPLKQSPKLPQSAGPKKGLKER